MWLCCILTFLHTQLCQCCTSTSESNKKELRKSLISAPLVSSAVDSSTSYRRFEDSTSDESSGSSFSESPSPEKEGGGESEEEGDGELPYHTIVIDCAPIGFADSMGITVLEQVCETRGTKLIKWFTNQFQGFFKSYFMLMIIV